MITEKDLKAAIAECQGARNPDASTCIKLAAFYTIQREMFGEEKNAEPHAYSYAPAPMDEVYIESESDFAKAINGKPQSEVWKVLDEMMDTVEVIHPKLYRAVLDRLR